jgi:hypothetical protein
VPEPSIVPLTTKEPISAAPGSGFARDSPLEGAVHCELVSEVKIPAPVTKLGADSGRVMG